MGDLIHTHIRSMKITELEIIQIFKKNIVYLYNLMFNLILYLFNEDCQQSMATSGFPQNEYMNT